MKRFFFILLADVVGVVLILLFKPKPPAIDEAVVSPLISTNTSMVVVVTNFEAKNVPVETASQIPLTAITSSEHGKLLDATRTQSIAEWTNAIPNLKLRIHSKYYDSWSMAQIAQTNSPRVNLTGVNGNIVEYTADLISIGLKDDYIRTIEMHSPKMNIEEIRKFGKQLCELQGLDATDFLTWCDKVGNQWVDAPLYDGKSLPLPNNNKFYGFGILRTYNNEKPWCINFFIASP